MRICYMSNYNQVCGISDYTGSLVRHIPKEHEVIIIAPKLGGEHHSLVPVGEEDARVHRLYNATVWDGIIGIDIEEIDKIATSCDVVHFQFQDAVFHHEWMWPLVQRLKGRVKLVITLHDNCLGKIYPLLPDFNAIITMKPEVQRQVTQSILLPMPTYDLQPVIKGFGLGRSKHANIGEVCASLGYKYEYTKAEEKWIPIDELLTWLRDSDGIVLYYDEVGTAGSSAAARTAISTRRPVFVNRVTWFNDLPEDTFIKFNDDNDLKEKLQQVIQKPYVNSNSFNEVVKQHIEIYKNII